MYFSKTLLPDANIDVGDFVNRHARLDLSDYCSMAVFENGELIAGTLYHNYYQKSGVVELSSASINRRWLTKPVINAMFFLPFIRLGCQICVLRVSERNENMIGIARKFGFSEVYIPRLRGRDEGEFVFSLTDDAWSASPYNMGRV